jgi:hypothetical protein
VQIACYHFTSSTKHCCGLLRVAVAATSCRAVSSSTFWKHVHNFGSLNSPLQQAIASLSSDSASLSDAARTFSDINKRMITLDGQLPPTLLTHASVATLQERWDSRFRNHRRPHHYVALLLDPRAHMWQFVRNEPAVMGTGTSYGNGPLIQTAEQFVRAFSDCLVDDDCPAIEKEVNRNNQPKASAEKKVLAGALRVLLECILISLLRALILTVKCCGRWVRRTILARVGPLEWVSKAFSGRLPSDFCAANPLQLQWGDCGTCSVTT